jgi:hypothetical protein
LNFPDYHFSFRESTGRFEIFDPARKRYVSLTPEEWVRQNLIQYLVNEKNMPLGLIVVEKSLKVLKMENRFDLMVYSRDGFPRMLVECKAPEVNLTQDVFDQVARYNIAFKVSYLLISNGLKHFCCYVDFNSGQFELLKDIPDFKSLEINS